MAARDKALTLFAQSNTGIVSSNPTQVMDVCAKFKSLVYSMPGRAMAQAVSRRLPTAAALVQTRVWSCEIL
jgi:hypothetical protein